VGDDRLPVQLEHGRSLECGGVVQADIHEGLETTLTVSGPSSICAMSPWTFDR
jgi:hypothetical protein